MKGGEFAGGDLPQPLPLPLASLPNLNLNPDFEAETVLLLISVVDISGLCMGLGLEVRNWSSEVKDAGMPVATEL